MSRGTRVRNTITGKTGMIVKHIGNARWEVAYEGERALSLVLGVFLEVIE